MKAYLVKIVKGEKKGLHAEFIKVFLWILSILYAIWVRSKAFSYGVGLASSAKLPKPVISIGNITTGGTGKTPLVAYLAKKLRTQGKKPAVLIRGYMDQKNEESDEAELLRKELGMPVLVGPDRVASAQHYLRKGTCDCFIMDDGFSHLKLKRDLDIVAIDATDPWGRNHLLPRGFLREPLGHLRRAHVFVLTRCDQAKAQLESITEKLKRINSRAGIFCSTHQPEEFIDLRTKERKPLSAIKEQKICVVSAIGSSAGFERSLRDLGGRVLRHFSYPDHYAYRQKDIKAIAQFCMMQKIKILVTTEKDRVKLDKLCDGFATETEVWSLKINLTITENEDAFLKRVTDLL